MLSTTDCSYILVLGLLFQQKHSDLKMGQKWVTINIYILRNAYVSCNDLIEYYAAIKIINCNYEDKLLEIFVISEGMT